MCWNNLTSGGGLEAYAQNRGLITKSRPLLYTRCVRHSPHLVCELPWNEESLVLCVFCMLQSSVEPWKSSLVIPRCSAFPQIPHSQLVLVPQTCTCLKKCLSIIFFWDQHFYCEGGYRLFIHDTSSVRLIEPHGCTFKVDNVDKALNACQSCQEACLSHQEVGGKAQRAKSPRFLI